MTVPDAYADILGKVAFWHVATIGPDGDPQSTPVWAGTDDEGHVTFSLTKTRQKYRNLQANPAVALSATDPENSYRYLEIRGTVARIDDDPENAFIDSMAKKYMGVDDYPFHQPGDERVVVRVKPEHTTAMG
ncbi:MAG: PPOX class F420-dependent oxidoreductase [Acidimicrobiales bacterium]|nr:PPOX class F420-dependent oxidoreductase [Acidimicrobiales bacterium]